MRHLLFAPTKTSAYCRCRRGMAGAWFSAACFALAPAISTAEDGKALFEANCSACHTIGGGPSAGPDLKDIVAKRGRQAVLTAVSDPSKAGLKPTMPNLGLPGKSAEAIVAYLEQTQGAAGASGLQPAASGDQTEPPPLPISEAEVRRGADLFDGRMRFTNGGPSCNACHHVESEAVTGGGALAADLTPVFSRMGQKGLTAVLGSNPFPAMQAAYGKGLTQDEIRQLVGFLEKPEKEQATRKTQSFDMGWKLFGGGAGGAVLLIGFFSLVGRRRKKASVNQAIYDRQIKSE